MYTNKKESVHKSGTDPLCNWTACCSHMPSITVLNINTFLNSNQILFLDKVLYVHNINIVVMQIAQKMKNTSERAIFVGGDECMVLKMILIAFLVIAFLWLFTTH